MTNDGATILKSISLDNPAAKILVNISKVQDDEVGDGTTSVCVLASELLREAEKLITIHHLHPQTAVEGFRIASRAALAALEGSAVDNGKDEKAFRQDLFNIARTTLSSKVLSQDKDYFANLAVDAVLRLKGSTDLEHIQIIKKVGGKLTDSYLDEGMCFHACTRRRRRGGSTAPCWQKHVWKLMLTARLYPGQADCDQQPQADRERQDPNCQHLSVKSLR